MFGNVLANTLENIDELLKMPYGCGEQNMYNFAPSAFIYEYLKKTGQLTDEIEEKAFKIMQTGYQRELTYRHSAGGYSGWHNFTIFKDMIVSQHFVQHLVKIHIMEMKRRLLQQF